MWQALWRFKYDLSLLFGGCPRLLKPPLKGCFWKKADLFFSLERLVSFWRCPRQSSFWSDVLTYLLTYLLTTARLWLSPCDRRREMSYTIQAAAPTYSAPPLRRRTVGLLQWCAKKYRKLMAVQSRLEQKLELCRTSPASGCRDSEPCCSKQVCK